MTTSFVRCSARRFNLAGVDFQVAGVNCYFLAYCSEESRRASMNMAKQMGANAIRAWAFLEVDDRKVEDTAFQYLNNGVITYDNGPLGLQRMDALIHAAEEMELRLILPLVNYWPDFGGMPLYLKWLGIEGGVTEFYRRPEARIAYRNWVEHVLTRRNSITGRLYSEEPAIMAWELTNEARCEIDYGKDLLLDWVAEMSGFVKQLDSNHLLAAGDEGFFGKHWLFQKGSGHLYDGSHGTDFDSILKIRQIDFGGYHFYPQNWGYQQDLDFADKWIRDHAKSGQDAGKPVLLEEYGLGITGVVNCKEERDAWFAKWSKTVEKTQTAGALLWVLGGTGADTSGYRDEFAIFDTAEVTGFRG